MLILPRLSSPIRQRFRNSRVFRDEAIRHGIVIADQSTDAVIDDPNRSAATDQDIVVDLVPRAAVLDAHRSAAAAGGVVRVIDDDVVLAAMGNVDFDQGDELAGMVYD